MIYRMTKTMFRELGNNNKKVLEYVNTVFCPHVSIVGVQVIDDDYAGGQLK